MFVGRKDLITAIGSRAYELGLEAQAGQYVGVANALMHGRDGTSGVDWSQAIKIGYALLLSPLILLGWLLIKLLS